MFTNKVAGYLVLCSFLTVTPPLYAQSDLLDQGLELLQNDDGDLSLPDTTSLGAGDLTTTEIAKGLKQALKVGTRRVVKQVSKTDGYFGDEAIRLPLPDSLQTVQSALDAVGMSSLMDDLELKLNRAAEAASEPAKDIFINAVSKMTIEDVEGIYNGPDDAATKYFRKKTSKPLSKAMAPIVDESLQDVGAIDAYDAVMAEYQSLPLVPDVKADLNDYVVEKGMDGLFYYIAQEEAAIRQDPVKRSTELLQKVFGAN
ncbi:MAG: DUF4197 domain-containing protein [Pseudomonadota bacterium]